MEKLSIKFDNGCELEIDSINENYNVSGKMRGLNLHIPFRQEDDTSVEAAITPENMKHFIVLADSKPMDEFTDYSDVRSIDKMINKNEQYFNVQCIKNNK